MTALNAAYSAVVLLVVLLFLALIQVVSFSEPRILMITVALIIVALVALTRPRV